MLQNYVTKLRYQITLRNYITKLLRETKKNRNYVRILANPKPRGKNRALYCGKYPYLVVPAVSFN